MSVRALVILAILLAVPATSQFHPVSATSAVPASYLLDTRTLKTASGLLKGQARRHVIWWLRHQAAVRMARPGYNGRTVEVTFRDGTRGVILPHLHAGARLAGGKLAPRHQAQTEPGAPKPRALVLEPFASELGLGPHAGDPEVAQLQAAGYQVDQLYDTAANVQAMKTISAYNVVYDHTHSDPFGSGDGVVATGQLATNDASVAAELQSGSVVKVTVSGDAVNSYYAITSAFIRNYVGQFFGNSIVFLNGCGLLKAPNFFKALSDKGVGVMVSWDIEATSQDNYLGAAAFFAEMNKGLSVAGAIAAEQAAGYGKSTVNGQAALLGYLGDGRITLVAAANPPPTSTPVPRATLTPTTAASVPFPTFTPTVLPVATVTEIPGPQLTISVKPKVKPGTSQVIAIRSSPETVIRIHVRFPSGDSRSATTATNQQGVASYRFRQRANRITFGHVYGTVSVDAVKGNAISTRTVQYRIGFAPVDVSVQPRSQSAGHRVSIWVHTQARTPFIVYLRFPKGRVHPIPTKSNAHGWVHLYYRVGTGLKANGNHTVLVRVRAYLGGHLNLAETTFKIL